MKVKLTYFKTSGKYYSDGEYNTTQDTMHGIWQEVRLMRTMGKLPGLVDGCSEFITSVDVPEHKYNHPHIII